MPTKRTRAQCLEFRRKRQWIRFVKAFRANRRDAQKFPHIEAIDMGCHQRAYVGIYRDRSRWQKEAGF